MCVYMSETRHERGYLYDPLLVLGWHDSPPAKLPLFSWPPPVADDDLICILILSLFLCFFLCGSGEKMWWPAQGTTFLCSSGRKEENGEEGWRQEVECQRGFASACPKAAGTKQVELFVCGGMVQCGVAIGRTRDAPSS